MNVLTKIKMIFSPNQSPVIVWNLETLSAGPSKTKKVIPTTANSDNTELFIHKRGKSHFHWVESKKSKIHTLVYFALIQDFLLFELQIKLWVVRFLLNYYELYHWGTLNLFYTFITKMKCKFFFLLAVLVHHNAGGER